MSPHRSAPCSANASETASFVVDRCGSRAVDLFVAGFFVELRVDEVVVDRVAGFFLTGEFVAVLRVDPAAVARDRVDDAGFFDVDRATVVPERFDELEAREDLFFVATACSTLTAATSISSRILDASRERDRYKRSFER